MLAKACPSCLGARWGSSPRGVSVRYRRMALVSTMPPAVASKWALWSGMGASQFVGIELDQLLRSEQEVSAGPQRREPSLDVRGLGERTDPRDIHEAVF